MCIANYRRGRHHSPFSGTSYLHELQHDHIQEWIKVMLAPDEDWKETCCNNDTRSYFAVLRTALNYAKKKLKLISENPATDIDLPPVKKKKRSRGITRPCERNS